VDVDWVYMVQDMWMWTGFIWFRTCGCGLGLYGPGHVDVDWVYMVQDMWMWTGFIWSRTCGCGLGLYGPVTGFLKHGNEPSSFIKGRKCLIDLNKVFEKKS
jgi:hypothetical protein